MGFSTTAIHAGNEPDPTTGAVTVPIYQTSTYQQEGLGKPRGGYEYARTQNPTRLAGEHVVVSDNTYGGTFRLFSRVLADYGVEFSYVDTTDALNVEAALRPNTRMVFVETPTNPVMM